MACILGFLLVGVIYLVHATHATPYVAEYPSMLSEVGRAVFGNGLIGKIMYVLLQTASAAILFFGANTSFNGFPALTSFVAEDSFLPRPMMKRGHRLVFSNAIIMLTALAVTLVIVTGGSVDAVVPLFAMGVFTGFSMAGYGMTKHHLTQREPGWRRKLVINLSAAILSTIVVGIFAVAKFTEGAWLVVVVFPILVFALMRLNRQYRAEASVLENVGDRASGRGQASAASSIHLCRPLRPRGGRGAALRDRAARRQADPGALRDRCGARVAAAAALGAFRGPDSAADDRVPGSPSESGRTRAGPAGDQRPSGHQGDGVAAAANICAAGGPAVA